MLDRMPVESIAARLYAWNRLPSSAWRQVQAEPALIVKAASAAASADWEQIAPGPPAAPWCIWRPRGARSMPTAQCWKLYLSPRPRHLAQAVRVALGACGGLCVVSLKYGLDADGMLRPDKLVVHLADLQSVHVLGERLLRALDGVSAHGVPFTCEIGGDGLISWGVDPPPNSPTARIAPSWRLWVTQVLARALRRRSDDAVAPWERALRELERAGVDSRTWEPSRDLWAEESTAMGTAG